MDYKYYWQAFKPHGIVLYGEPKISKSPFMGLEIGDRVIKIGDEYRNDESASINRQDTFELPLIYSGISFLKLHEHEEGKKFKLDKTLLFELPREYVPDGVKETAYLVYIVLEHKELKAGEKCSIELKTPWLSANAVRIFKPYFTIIDENGKEQQKGENWRLH